MSKEGEFVGGTKRIVLSSVRLHSSVKWSSGESPQTDSLSYCARHVGAHGGGASVVLAWRTAATVRAVERGWGPRVNSFRSRMGPVALGGWLEKEEAWHGLCLVHYMTIFEKLREEHDKTRTLLALVSKTHGDSEGRRQLFARLKDELEHHETAEEVSLYKPLLGTNVQSHATHSTKEHEEARQMLAELEELDFSSPAWLPKYEKLKESVLHHMDEEEHIVFQQAGRALDDSQKERLAKTHEEQREKLDN